MDFVSGCLWRWRTADHRVFGAEPRAATTSISRCAAGQMSALTCRNHCDGQLTQSGQRHASVEVIRLSDILTAASTYRDYAMRFALTDEGNWCSKPGALHLQRPHGKPLPPLLASDLRSPSLSGGTMAIIRDFYLAANAARRRARDLGLSDGGLPRIGSA